MDPSRHPGAEDRGAVDRDEGLLLAVLNSAPVVDGHRDDRLAGASGRELARSWGGTGTAAELDRLRRTRDAIQTVIRGDAAAPAAVADLASVVEGAVRTPRVTADGVVWELRVPRDDRLPVDAVLAWSTVTARLPGRLRPCANDECELFLLDRSRPGTARWCSMATCGNRMKARAHAQRVRD
ncbi:CGNR zinc finger domain-containing protein [Clavibacter michiganensis subsp. michiganensis]|nr:CGNR zinc finger domain-containing protein [Clavibacter michiganensis]MBE3078250.1 CGNR zinc finger domain-containing protein [Clavibacter michiganensis subsp. michiganensis]MBW8027521.1 CGNR zinc finger domain-containing protein [Clavibacter michiganensis subsp. michiganensis]MWJ04715.1 CGNR zinc finger domain-containing protein [Clavibacter michiganensis subsp. michiganensis]MWJ09410.1 CGNR zinc finger domain-containing protein [Clavibacter michiganensis subsp. michiganensis]MWJ16162.1 CG